MARVLIAERDPALAALIRDALSRMGYAIDAHPDAGTGLLVCDSIESLRSLRARGLRAPALLLSAEDVDGLGDVARLPKPFDLDELRWEAALRLDPPRATGGRSGPSGPGLSS